MSEWFEERYRDRIGLSLKTTEKLFSKQSSFQKIDVYDTIAYGRLMTLDGMVMCTEKDEFVYHEMITHVAALSHPEPHSILVIGGGDGGTIRELVKHGDIARIDLCEIDGDVIQVSKDYFPTLNTAFDHPKVNVHVDDGIAFIARAQPKSYQIVIIDSSEPIGPGEGLFTEAFYTDVKRVLTDNGIMIAQTEAPFVCGDMIGRIYSHLRPVFAQVKMFTAPIPTYPSGYWSWAFCSKQQTDFLQKSAETVSKTTSYYNEAIHQAAFALPNFVKALIEV